MAVSSNRSPSPISTGPNPDSRTPESNSATRRSFSSNPFPRPSILTKPRSFDPATPANSPADFGGRRHSIGKEVGAYSRGYEEKENEKEQNLKPVKARSPAVSKGVKNFMAPTISAASKVNPSPRKKVLAERNELIRSSVSSSDGKSSFGSVKFSDVVEDIDSKLEMDLNQNKVEDSNNSTITNSDHKEELEMDLNQNKVEDSNNSTITNSDHKEDVFEIPETAKASKGDISFNSQVPLNSRNHSEPVESNCFSPSPSCCKYKPYDGSSVSPIIAPLDADPSLPPYDPKTNYLSPRPRFRCYNPNQRIEIHLHKEKGLGCCSKEGKRVDESFMSESFSDTEVTEETESENSQKDTEDASSAEVINQDKEPQVSEPKPSSSSAPAVSHVSKEATEAKRVLRPKFLARSKSIALLLVFLIFCLSISVTDSPVFDSSVYNDLSMYEFYVPSEITMFAKASFDGLARYVKHWSYNSIGYLSKLVRILGGIDELGPLQFSNLTYLQEDLFVNEYLEAGHNVETHKATEGEAETELQEEKDEPAAEADDSEIEEYTTLKAKAVEPYSSEVLQSEEQSHTALPMPFEDQSVLTSKASEFKYEVEDPEVVEKLEYKELCSGDKTESTIAGANSEHSSEMAFPDVHAHGAVDSSSRNMWEDELSVHHMLAISLLVLALGAAAAFIYLKQGKRATALLNEKMNCSPVSASIKQINLDRPSSQIWQTGVDMDGEESCPSELSSFQKSSTYIGRMARTNEAQSQERKERKNYKRESLASSSGYSMGSSYGSFTTYEKIPSKHGCDDAEIVTPVRRSSRIKNQVTSP